MSTAGGEKTGHAPLTLGTAGHIDHGKTALIAVLTGTDTDRLPEERRRGISIALGYARLRLPSGRTVSVVDVPGHERFVRTMVAGATGIDCFLAVVAADDGVMPQTREHAAVLRALGVARGVVAVTKADLLDPARAAEEAAELFPGAEVVAVSARTGAGLDDLRAALDRLAAATPSRAAAPAAFPPSAVNVGSASQGGSERPPPEARLHIDRVFTVRGVGTVVTGTLWSGTVGRGDELVLVAGDDSPARTVRVRAVQVHDADVDRAAAGQRVAVNLTGTGRDEVARGDVLLGAGPGSPDDDPARPRSTFRVQVRLDHDPPDRVMVHHGTRETPARVVARGDGVWQLRLKDPVVAAAGDRLVVRAIAPPDTLGGGIVLDPSPPRSAHDPASAPADAERGTSREIVAGATGSRLPPAAPASASASAPPAGPAEPPVPDPVDEEAEELLRVLRAGGLEPPRDAELGADDVLGRLRERGDALRLGPAMHLATDVYAQARDRVVALLEAETSVTLARVRDELGSSRRVVQALLERLDADRVTLRRGDERVLRRRSRRPPSA